MPINPDYLKIEISILYIVQYIYCTITHTLLIKMQ